MVDGDERVYIGTTRFNNVTFEENIKWRKKHNWKGCIYGCSKKMPISVPTLALVYVIEMNNDINKIMGIGVVRNYINMEYSTCIYRSNTNYNRYIYNSSVRKDRSELNEKLLLALELMVFKGYEHFKRGHGITMIPWKRFGEQAKLIREMFQKIFNLLRK